MVRQLELNFDRVSVLPWHVEHAYTPNEQASYGGGDHIVVEQDFTFGRLKRKAGDPLCKKRGRFKFLQETGDERDPNCKKCLEIAARLNKEIAFIGGPQPDDHWRK